MAQTNTRAGKYITSTDGGAGTGGTITLPEPGANMAWVIDMIHVYLTGTITAFAVTPAVEGGATALSKAGGQAGAVFPMVIPGPIACDKDGATQVVLTSTGGTNWQLTVTAHQEAA